MRRKECKNGKRKSSFAGNFGLNNYNLLTFVILSFNIVSNLVTNINNNSNNNNNNNNVARLGQAKKSEEKVTSENSNSNMVMITVPPAGPPIVIPAGRKFQDGDDVIIQFDQKQWRVFGNKTVQMFKNNQLVRTIEGAVFRYGLIDQDHYLTEIFQRDQEPPFKEGKLFKSSEVIRDFAVKVKDVEIAHRLKEILDDVVLGLSKDLVLMGISPKHPVMFRIGKLLQNGSVWLNHKLARDGTFQMDNKVLDPSKRVLKDSYSVLDNVKIVIGTLENNGIVKRLPEEIDLFSLDNVDIGSGPAFKMIKIKSLSAEKNLDELFVRNIIASFVNESRSVIVDDFSLSLMFRNLICDFRLL